MNETLNNSARMVTTVNPPIWLRQEIQLAGYTMTGALVAGWIAIKSKETIDNDFVDVRKNMDLYRAAYLNSMKEIEMLKNTKVDKK